MIHTYFPPSLFWIMGELNILLKIILKDHSTVSLLKELHSTEYFRVFGENKQICLSIATKIMWSPQEIDDKFPVVTGTQHLLWKSSTAAIQNAGFSSWEDLGFLLSGYNTVLK